MANKNLFSSAPRGNVPIADTVNSAGGLAYAMPEKEALAQMIVTGTFNNTFYTDAKAQLDKIVNLLTQLGPENAEFVAKLAIYARKRGYMKDTPAFLTAWLTVNGSKYVKSTFDRVIDNGKMLRNFVQIMRSGAVGRKSLGTLPKKLVQNWINNASDQALLSASVGTNPSLADVIKMVHPAAPNQERNAFYKWLLGSKDFDFAVLPEVVQDLISFRNKRSRAVPNVPFELLTSLELSREDWVKIARNAGWQMTRMNLNTFERKGVYQYDGVVEMIADRLRDPKALERSRVMPYQIFTAWKFADASIPSAIRRALEEALDATLSRVPVYDGKVWVFVDVSGSMVSPITGVRNGSSTNIRCVDVASLIASSLLRVNPHNTHVVMFDTKIHKAKLNPKDSVMKNADIIARFGGGGTACQLPLQMLNDTGQSGDLIIYVSDNESWMRSRRTYFRGPESTDTSTAWAWFKKKNPNAKMVCIDLVPNTTVQVINNKDVLNVGGFNDAVYDVIGSFMEQGTSSNFWTSKIEESVDLSI